MRGKTVIPRTNSWNVVLLDYVCILAYVLLSGDALHCMNVIVYYGYIFRFGLSATSQEMLSTARGAE